MMLHRRMVVPVALLALSPAAAPAAPLTEPAFVTYFSQNAGSSSWRNSTRYLQNFVHWNFDAPEWNKRNIGWVRMWGAGDIVLEPPAPCGLDLTIPPWERASHAWPNGPGGYYGGSDSNTDNGYGYDYVGGVTVTVVPEPGSLAFLAAFLGTLLLRRPG